MWGVGTVMIIFLASLLDVPEQLYEAAELDGANAWQRLVHVTLPAISPVILFAVVTGVIEALQYFTQGYVAGTVAGGGDSGVGAGSSLGYPEGSTLFYPVWLYQQGFQYFNMGYASAMAVALVRHRAGSDGCAAALRAALGVRRGGDGMTATAGQPRRPLPDTGETAPSAPAGARGTAQHHHRAGVGVSRCRSCSSSSPR